MQEDSRVLAVALELEDGLSEENGIFLVLSDRRILKIANFLNGSLVASSYYDEFVVHAIAVYNAAYDDLLLFVNLAQYFIAIIEPGSACIIKLLLFFNDLSLIEIPQTFQRNVYF